jgi:hypothetical protein
MWKFGGMARSDEVADPIQGEFFSADGVAEKVVREALQNSLDARSAKNGEPARVIFSYRMGQKTFGELSKEPDGVFHGILPHLRAPGNGLRNIPAQTEIVDYLVVEDFGTRGLNGYIEETEREGAFNKNDGSFHDFYYFWRNIGRSGKKDSDLGSWGLGKQVFPAASKINTYFGLSARSTDGRIYYMGKSVLKTHHVSGRQHRPYGYFAQFHDDGFAVPFEKKSDQDAFSKTFIMERGAESGLSVIIPFPHNELGCKNGIIQATIREFFFPVVHGDLEVIVQYPESPQISITASTIKGLVREYCSDDSALADTVDLALRCIGSKPEDKTVLTLAGTRWKDIELPTKEIDAIGAALNSKGFAEVVVPVSVTRCNIEHRSHFSVFISQTSSNIQAQCRYIRDGIDIKEASTKKMDQGISAILEIREEKLSGLLNRTENPAHTKWIQRDKDNDRLADYEGWSLVISFVKDAPHEVLRQIFRKELEENRDILNDIFYLEEKQNARAPAQTAKKEKEDVAPDPKPIEPSPPRKLQLSELTQPESGFSICKTAAYKGTLEKLTVRAAYHVLKGSPLKKYKTFDFQLQKNPISIQSPGLKILECQDNRLIADIVSQDFRLTITGFDGNRDLFVDFDAEGGALNDSQG